MDSTNTGTIVGGVGIALSVLSMIFAAVNHKKLRAKCCGRVIEMELDVSNTPHPDATTGADKRKTVKIHPLPPTDIDVERALPIKDRPHLLD